MFAPRLAYILFERHFIFRFGELIYRNIEFVKSFLLYYKNGNFYVLLYYLTPHTQIGYKFVGVYYGVLSK